MYLMPLTSALMASTSCTVQWKLAAAQEWKYLGSVLVSNFQNAVYCTSTLSPICYIDVYLGYNSTNMLWCDFTSDYLLFKHTIQYKVAYLVPIIVPC